MLTEVRTTFLHVNVFVYSLSTLLCVLVRITYVYNVRDVTYVDCCMLCIGDLLFGNAFVAKQKT